MLEAPSDCCVIADCCCGRVALAVQQAGDAGEHEGTVLLALLVGLRDELVLLRELLVGEVAGLLLCGARHGFTSEELEVRGWRLEI